MIVLAATAFASRWSLATDEWRVMTDEMLYLKLSQSIAETLSPVGQVRGEPYGIYSQLYPILMAPVIGLFDFPVAFRIGHVLTAFLMASTAIPTYLLARLVVPASRLAALIAATLSAFVPWLTLSLSLMTEAAGYPAFMWAAYTGVLCVARPSVKHDVLGLAGVLVAFLARAQFIYLALALPVAVLVHEVGFRLASRSLRRWPRSLWDSARAAVAGHPLLVVAIVMGLAATQLVPSYAPLGSYQTVITSHQGLPAGMLDSLYDHLTPLVIGLGLAPAVLALGWFGENLLRPAGRTAHAFAVYAILAIPALALIATYFDLTHGGIIVQERYAFYFVPLISIAAVGYLVDGRWLLRSLGLGAVAVTLLLIQSPYPPSGAFPAFSSPVRFTFFALDFRAGQVGSVLGFDDLGTAPVLAATTLVFAALLVVLLRSGLRRFVLPAAGVVLLAWGIAVTAYVFPKVLYEHESLAQGVLGQRPVAQRDWIDGAVSSDAAVALVPSTINSRGDSELGRGSPTDPAVWWEAEFWNKAVRRNYSYAGGATHAPFHVETMELDESSGRLRVSGDESDYLVLASSNVRLGIDGELVASYPDLDLYQPHRPYRATWAAGVTDDGLLASDRFDLTLYGRQRSGPRLHQVELLLNPAVVARDRYRVRGRGIDRRGRLAGPISFDVCVAAGRQESVGVRTEPGSQTRLIRVRVEATSAGC